MKRARLYDFQHCGLIELRIRNEASLAARQALLEQTRPMLATCHQLRAAMRVQLRLDSDSGSHPLLSRLLRLLTRAR
jgi:hypothetical protein